MRRLQISFGLLAWLIGGGTVLWCASDHLQKQQEGTTKPSQQLWSYATGQRQSAELEFDDKFVCSAGDPIYLVDHEGDFHQVGEVRMVRTADGRHALNSTAATYGEALFYPTRNPIPVNATVTYHTTESSVQWVLETMLPAEKREQIGVEISNAFADHHEEIITALQPIVRESLYEVFGVIESDLPKVIAKHRSELEKIGGRYQADMVERELVPLVKKEIFPIVRKHAEPVAEEVGGEIWQRVSLWKFGWRLAADKIPLTKKKRFQEEWQRFVNKEVVPILEKHSDEFVEVTQDIVKETAANKAVQKAVRSNVQKIVEDPAIQKVVWSIIKEAIVDNPRMREAMEKHWTGPKAKKAFQIAGKRLQPTVHRIGELLFGNLNEGITPEFQTVLRNQILGKDKRWFLIQLPDEPIQSPNTRLVLPVSRGTKVDSNATPFVTSIRD